MLSLALKEWAAVISALESGTQILLFRKGGISESGGDFHMENDEFLLYPTFEHQNAALLKPEFRHLVEESDLARNGHLVSIRSFARVERITLMTDRAGAEKLSGDHIWNEAYVDMRFANKPDRPLYVIKLRVFRLSQRLEFIEKTEYVGCKSWVQLDEGADTMGAIPVLSATAFQVRLRAS